MYECMNVCKYMCMYVRMCVCMYVGWYVCMCVYVCIYVHMYMCIYICMYIYVCICLYVCMYECIYVYIASVTGKKYRTQHNVSCTSNNLVYCISCIRCRKQYVGKTKNSLKQRFQGHFYQIAHGAEKTEVSRHFNRNGHHGMGDVEIHTLDFVHQATAESSTTNISMGLEFDWIHRLHCLIPKGLNSLDGSY